MTLPNNDWQQILKTEVTKPYFAQLQKFIEDEYAQKNIYPKKEDIFNALSLTSYEDTKVVILGQDPYIKDGQAHGLSFSVPVGYKQPPSLKNIFKEITDDLGHTMSSTGCLVPWARQGVLLLNATLTVEAGKSNSHSKCGWQVLTTYIIEELSKKESPIVFLLWGKFAQEKATLIDGAKHLVLTAAHPSPLARGAFFGCGHFSKTNEFLRQHGKNEIDWRL